MSATQIPPQNTELKAIGAVSIYQQAAPGPRHNYSEQGFSVGIASGVLQPIPPGNDRDYQTGDPMGHSMGSQVIGPDGQQYLKIECFQWHYRKVALFLDESYREYHIGYVLLSERDQTWSALTADGTPTADVLSGLIADFKATVLDGYLATGVPEPTDYNLITDATGQPKLYLTFANGYKVEAGKFDDLPLPDKLSLTARTVAPAPDPKPTTNIWAIIAGAGLFTLLAVVILIQVQRRRNNQTL